MKTKILHVISSLNIGGAELVLKRLILAHQNSEHIEHSVISLTTKGPIGQQLETAGIQVTALNVRSPYGFFKSLWQLKKLMQSLQPDVVQTWMYHADFLGGIAARMANMKRILWTIRCVDISSGGARSARWLRRPCALLSHVIPHQIICVANAAKTFHAGLGYQKDRMVVIPNGFDLNALQVKEENCQRLREACRLSKEDRIIGIVGRFNPDKDFANFIKAASIVAQQDESVKFLLVGEGIDTQNAPLLQWITSTGFSERFVLLGKRDDITTCLGAMQIFCLSSKTEGMPSVVGEAMALQIPCVVTDVGETATLVGETGIVVPKENAKALAEGMLTLLKYTPEERSQLGKRARARIAEHYSLNQMLRRYEGLYLTFVPDKKPLN